MDEASPLAAAFRRWRWWWALGMLVFAFAASLVWNEVTAPGARDPPLGGPAAYLWGLGWTIALMGLILITPVPRADKTALLLLWCAKILVGMGLMIFYEAHYPTLDAFGYYERATSPEFEWPGLGLRGGVGNIDAFVHVMLWVVPDSFHAVKMTFALIGLVGTYLFYRAARMTWPDTRLNRLLLLGLFPSLLFWSSILGKDPLILLGLGTAALGAALLSRGRGIGIPVFLVGLVAVLLVRPWIVPMLVLPTLILAAAALWGGPTTASRARWAWGSVLVLAVGSLALVILAAPTATMTDWLDRVNETSRAWAHGGSGQTPPEFNDVWGVLGFLPLGVFTALFRPLPGEVPSAFGLLAGLEGLALLVLVVAASMRIFRRGPARSQEAPVVWGVLFIAMWALVYAFISYQNLGSGFRFRMQILPVGLLVLDRLLSTQRLGDPVTARS